MIHPSSALTEKKGVWYLDGMVVRIGDQLQLQGVAWKIVGFGRSLSPEQRTFLWIQNQDLGTTIYNPALDDADANPTLIPIAQTLTPRAFFKNN